MWWLTLKHHDEGHFPSLCALNDLLKMLLVKPLKAAAVALHNFPLRISEHKIRARIKGFIQSSRLYFAEDLRTMWQSFILLHHDCFVWGWDCFRLLEETTDSKLCFFWSAAGTTTVRHQRDNDHHHVCLIFVDHICVLHQQEKRFLLFKTTDNDVQASLRMHE